MKLINNVKKKTLLLTLCLSFLLTACGVPEEKIAKAQEVYAQLADIHNQVVESHKTISSDAYDDELTALADKITQIQSYNLYEMNEEDIDLLIEAMNSIIASYEEYLTAIQSLKAEEDAAVLTALPVTLINGSSLSFSSLCLYEEGSSGMKVNVLENTDGFAPSQTLTGLIVQRDVDNTNWILSLEDTEGNIYEFTLPVADLKEEINHITLTYDSELAQLDYILNDESNDES